jgi:hypothetical protein
VCVCAAVAAAGMPEGHPCRLACAVMYDPYYAAIPKDSPARSRWLSGCPALVVGSSQFNTPNAGGTITAEDKEVGLQVRSFVPLYVHAHGASRSHMNVLFQNDQGCMSGAAGARAASLCKWSYEAARGAV